MMLIATLGLVAITAAMTVLLQSELRKDREARNLARAQQVAEIASLFDLYVHLNKVTFGQAMVDSGTTTYQLTGNERAAFESFADGVAAAVISGFDLNYLVIILTDGQALNDVFGVLHLSANEDRAYADLDGLLSALEGFGLNSGRTAGDTDDRLLALSDQMETWLGRALAADETVILTAALSGVPEDYVLREPRAGHAPASFSDEVGALDLAGNDLTGVTLLTTDDLLVTDVMGDVSAGAMSGSLDQVTGTLSAENGVTTGNLQITGDLALGVADVRTVQAGQTTVTGSVDAQNLTATAGPLLAADSFAEEASVTNTMTGVDSVIVTDVLIDDSLSATTLDAVGLIGVQATIGTVTVGPSGGLPVQP